MLNKSTEKWTSHALFGASRDNLKASITDIRVPSIVSSLETTLLAKTACYCHVLILNKAISLHTQ
jgi:hypothetical protein